MGSNGKSSDKLKAALYERSALNIRRFLPLLCLPLATFASAQPPKTAPPLPATVPVVMLSDIHFDPFHDPAKLPQLRAAPVTQWAAILDAPPSPTQTADFAQIQSTCSARGVDTPAALLKSSLAAASRQQPAPLFVTLSGDLMAHEFDCRFHTLAPHATEADYTDFASTTLAFLALQLRLAFPHSPIYVALGNNDSGCHDYAEDPDSAFLRADARSFAADVVSPANRRAILSQFPTEGDYNIALPKPIQRTRFLVLQDMFESKKYTTCSGEKSPATAASQIAWLRAQLTAARAAHEHVWVMTHIPPGIDAYSTFAQGRHVCSGDKPEMFLRSEALADVITEFPDVIRLVIMAHTHMDEIRVFKTANGDIPGKLIPSVTPVNGNNPSFSVAEVDPATATLQDFTVYAASNDTPGGDIWNNNATKWAKEYSFSEAYHLPDLSGASLAKLTDGFLADKSSDQRASRDYEHFYFIGDPGLSSKLKVAAMHIVWPAYACSITSSHIADFTRCACATAP
jgi:sphingomyelin phosphodiesterase acid-like 3